MKIIFIGILFLSIFISCKRTNCPAFPNHLTSYFPYSKNQVIKFKNTNNDTLQIRIIDNWSSNKYFCKWKCPGCEAYSGFKTDLDNKFLIKIEANISIEGDNFSEIRLDIINSFICNDIFYIRKYGPNPYLSENNNLFGDTLLLEAVPKENLCRYNNVKIINGKGIVEFYDNKENCTWVKIE